MEDARRRRRRISRLRGARCGSILRRASRGYSIEDSKIGNVTMKRYCQTLELRDDPELIEAYVREHSRVWPEVQAGIREVGILDMQIYALGGRLFMIMDTVDEFDWVADNARLATLPRQAEWEAYMAKFQGTDPSLPSTDKWKLMDKIFELDK